MNVEDAVDTLNEMQYQIRAAPLSQIIIDDSLGDKIELFADSFGLIKPSTWSSPEEYDSYDWSDHFMYTPGMGVATKIVDLAPEESVSPDDSDGETWNVDYRYKEVVRENFTVSMSSQMFDILQKELESNI